MCPFIRNLKLSPILCVLLVSLLSLAGNPAQGETGTVSLAWDPNPEPDIAGYRVKYGLESGFLTGFVETEGPVVGATVSNLIPGETYHFAVLAFNNAGTEGPLSEEISYEIPLTGTAEISVVRSPSTPLIDGRDSGTLGNVFLGDSGAPQAFEIINTGSADLTDLTLSIDGTGSSDFILSPLATTTLGPGSRTSFSIVFKPTANGTRHATVRISSNDAEGNPFDIPIHGDGLTIAKIKVEDSLTGELVGGVSWMDFGNVPAGNAGLPATITIRNAGMAPLTEILVTLGGPQAPDFIVGTPDLDTLAPGESTSFQVAFSPAAPGARTATLQISSMGGKDGSFDIALAGNGIGLPRIVVATNPVSPFPANPASMVFASSELGIGSAEETFTISNSGSVTLTGLTLVMQGPAARDFTPSPLSVTSLEPGESTTVRVSFAPTLAGRRDATLRIGSNDPANQEFDVTLSGTGVAIPRIAVLDAAGAPLANGLESISFGNVGLRATSAVGTLTIWNPGSAPLTGLTCLLEGISRADFSVSPLETTTLAPGAGTTLRLSFRPSAVGSRTATLRLTSNDAETGPFTIRLTGSGIATPAIALEDAGGLPVDPGGEAFPEVPLGSAAKPVTYTIRNVGNVSLSGIRVSTDGADARSFLLSPPRTAFLAPGASTTFTITFKPDSAGAKTAGLRVFDSQAPGGRFRFSLAGTGFAVPEIKVISEDTVIPSGGAASMDFGTLNVKTETETRTLVIRNTGGARLTNLRITNEGPHARDFSCSGLKSSSIAPGKSARFSVAFSPTAAGSRSTTIRIESNSDPRPILLTFRGKGFTAPEIRIGIGKTDLVDDKAFIDFGTARPGKTGRSKTFTISNVGSATLKKLSLGQGGIDPESFTVGRVTSRSLKSGKSTTFKVTFKARKKGVSWGALRITSNDKDEKSFDIVLTGTGSDTPVKKTKKKKKKRSGKAKPAAPANLLSSTIAGSAPLAGVEVIDGRKYRTLTIASPPGSTLLPKDVEVSSDLVDWASGPRHTTVLRDDSGILKIRDNTPVTSQHKRFIRIRR